MFVHLHTHSEYSPLDGMIRIGEAFGIAKDLGQDALAITDHGNLAAAWAAQKAAEEAGVKFIPGAEMYLAIGSRGDKNVIWVPSDDDSADEGSERDDADEQKDQAQDEHAGMKARAYYHLTLLAYNAAGWANLVALNNESYKHVFHKPRIDFDLLAQHSEGIIALTGCLGGPVLGDLARGDEDSARAHLRLIVDAVGAENTYVELMEHGNELESAALPRLVEIAREEGVGIVATNDAHHAHADGAQAHAAWLLVQSKSTLASPKFRFHGEGYHLRTEDEMRSLRPEPWWQEACDTTVAIADRCAERSLPGKQDLLPKFPTPAGFADNRAYLKHLLADGAERIYGPDWQEDVELRARINEEFRVVSSAGMLDYFLVVHDLVSWAMSTAPVTPHGEPKKPILVGPGRGSAGGSEMAYLLGITRVPPREYGLLFERFYEAGRAEPPDIDLDFPQARRQDVIEYLRHRWGLQNVAQIGTVQMSRSKAAIKAAGRVLDESSTANRMSTLVPMVAAKPMPMAQLLEKLDSTADYRALIAKRPEARRIHEFASAFEDVVSGFSIHASGVIVSSRPLHEVVPLRRTDAGWVMQWSGPEAEDFGLLKVDVLGLRNLDIVELAADYIERETGERIDPTDVPNPDHPRSDLERARIDAAFRLIAEGRTAGIFQMESDMMTDLAMQIAPRSLDELSAVIALYRPGPMSAGMHTEFAARKRGEREVSYTTFTDDPDEIAELESVLGETYGVWSFQEQVMRLGTVVAGFDAAGRSKLRKAVSKKKADQMAIVGGMFRDGGVSEIVEDGVVVKRAFHPDTIENLWQAMLGSAEYLFNKSHSTTYGFLAFVTAYYKANWPAAYAAATLAVTADKADKRRQVLRDLNREGIEVLPPDINLSGARTEPAGEYTIRFGLCEVRDVGKVGARIVDARGGTAFASMHELYTRVHKEDGTGSAVTSSQVRALIESGALDAFGSRKGLMAVAGAAASTAIPAPDMEWGVLERSARQRASLLVALGEHPMTSLRDQLERVTVPALAGNGQFRDERPVSLEQLPGRDRAPVLAIAVLAGWEEKPYSRGRLANLTLESPDSYVQATVWDSELTSMYAEGKVPRVGQVVLVRGDVKLRSIAADPTDPDSEEIQTKQITVRRIDRVDVADETHGGWPPLLPDQSVPDLTQPVVLEAPAGPPTVAPSPPAPGGAVAYASTTPRVEGTAPVAVLERTATVTVETVSLEDALIASAAVASSPDGLVTHRPPAVLPGSATAAADGPMVIDWDGVEDGKPILLAPGRTSLLVTEMQSVLNLTHAQIRPIMDQLNRRFGPAPQLAMRATVLVGGQSFHVKVER